MSAAPLLGDWGQDKISHLMVVRKGSEAEESRLKMSFIDTHS